MNCNKIIRRIYVASAKARTWRNDHCESVTRPLQCTRRHTHSVSNTHQRTRAKAISTLLLHTWSQLRNICEILSARREGGGQNWEKTLAGGDGIMTRKWRGRELVIQGSHMVSGTRCPAWSNQLKRWSGSRAAAPKGRCPVGHGWISIRPERAYLG